MKAGHWALMALAALLGAGCAGLPHKHDPVHLNGSAPLDDLGAAGGQWPDAEWWKHYQDPTLDQLIGMAIGTSPTLATAHARYDSARQSVRIAGAASGARVVAMADMDRQRLSDNGLFPPELLGFHWYNQSDLGLQASYTFDWWGKQRDAVESAVDQAHAAQADRNAAALVLASSVADTYFGWQADQARLSLAHERESTLQQQGVIVAARVAADLESDINRHKSDVNIAAAREQIAALEGSVRLRVVALAALVGRSPSELPALQARPLPQASAALPDNVKIDLIARRADITASRWRVEAAERHVDSARAEFFPDVTINALLGLSSIDVGKLLEYGSRVPQASAAIHLPIFDAGRLKAQYGASQAAVDSAVAAYQDTLVGAARDVATQAATRAQIAAQRTQREIEVAEIARVKHGAIAQADQGLSDLRPVLDADVNLIDQRDALLQLDSAALSADIALQRALGGGYEHASDSAKTQSAAKMTP